jgi:hypothetical protein
VTAAPSRRRILLLWLAVTVVAAAVVTPLAVAVSRPLVHDWADTVGFTAGVTAACLAIRGVLHQLGASAPDG